MCTATTKRGIYVGTVVKNVRLCDDHYLLTLSIENFPPTRPGQFVQLQCRGLEEQSYGRVVEQVEGSWPKLAQPELVGKEPLLRRPFSIAGRRDIDRDKTCGTAALDSDVEQTCGTAALGCVGDEHGREQRCRGTHANGGTLCELDIIYRTIGTGTSWLRGVGAGFQLSLLGPLGNGFTIEETKPLAAVIGGGVGIPPMMYLARSLVGAGRQVVAFSGARTARLLPLTLAGGVEVSTTVKPSLCVEQFASIGVPSVIATDDATLGCGGTISEAFDDWLNVHLPAEGELVAYCCGPEALMRSVAEICLARGYQCELALERHMACGMGTCQSCVVKIRDDNEKGWSFKLCCTDGPVFDASEVLW